MKRKGEDKNYPGWFSDPGDELLPAEDLNDLLTEQNLLGIYIVQDQKIKYFNEAARQISVAAGWDLAIMSLEDVSSRVHPDDRDLFARSIDLHSMGKDKWETILIRFCNGTMQCKYWDVHYRGVRYHGRPAAFVAFIDVTQFKQAEIALRESEEKYLSLLHTSPDAIAVSDPSGNLVFISDNTYGLFGYEKGYSYQGLPLYSFVTPEDREKVQQDIQSVLSGNKRIRGEYTLIRKDGSLFFAEIHSAKLNGYEGNPKGIISVIRDITERKIAEKELLEAKNKAEKADRLKTAFLSNMSHEIRTPMNAIVGFAELLAESDLPNDKKTEYVSIIKKHGNALLNLIDDILDLAKIEAGELKIRHFECDPAEILREAVSSFEEQLMTLGKSEIELRLNIRKNISGKLLTDPARLRQILNNLLSNAVKFTHKGYIETGCYPEGEKENKKLVFYVEDSGIGMDPDEIPFIFDRFRQLDDSPTRPYPGTGLGLSIIKNLVKLLNGEIWVHSEKGKGSRFAFSLPLLPEHTGNIQEKKDFSAQEIPSWKNKTIIVAEDEPANLFYLQEILQKTGCTLLPAVNGQEVIALCQKHTDVDLVLMDIKMPVMGGFEATRILKKLYPSLPIIAQTAYAMQDDEQKCLDAGCDAYIAKPVFQDALFAKLAPYLNR